MVKAQEMETNHMINAEKIAQYLLRCVFHIKI